MVDEVKRTLAYICPVCGKTVIMERSVFQLAAGKNELPCPCGESALTVDMMGDRCNITVPCLFCGKDHVVSCSTHALLHEKTLAFSCAASGLDCLYIGEEEPVFAAMKRLEEAVDKLIADNDSEEKNTFLDPLVMEEVLGEVKDIASRGGISCACGSKEYGIKVSYSAVDLICAHCGATLRLPAATADDIDDICCKTKLVIKGKED